MGIEMSGMSFEAAEINGGPGTLVMMDGHAIAVLTLDVADGHITAIQLVVNPAKLNAIIAGRTLPL